MVLRIALVSFALALLTTGCGGPDPIDEVTELENPILGDDGPLRFPVEIYPTRAADFSSGAYTVQVAISVPAPGRFERLEILGHGLGYRDGNVVAGRLIKGGKASIRLNDGPWVLVSNETVQVAQPDEVWGGIGGGFRSVRFSVPLSRLGRPTVGRNVLSFRFNGTDGTSSGYRILSLNLSGPSGPLFDPGEILFENPNTWTAPAGGSAAAGEELWKQRNELAARPGAPRIRASCADCHDHEGRDLEYFSFSNLSIVSRSVFHGLSETQGRHVAAYVRSNPSGRWGRPWDPPYQPGPGIDDRPNAAERWAAGAGLGAVQATEDDETLRALFPFGRTPDGLQRVLRGAGLAARTINLREIPVAIQFPDWNSWLPEVHPLDIWGDVFATGEAFRAYERVHGTLRTRGVNALPAPALKALLEDLNASTRAFVGRGAIDAGSPWRSVRGPGSSVIERRRTGISVELAKRSLAQWMAVKHFEIVHDYELQDQGERISPTFGEKLSWPLGAAQTVHPVAPHIVGTNLNEFTSTDVRQTKIKGEYDSTAWYQLNLTLNAGARLAQGVQPVDWPYQYRHVYEAPEQARSDLGSRFAPIHFQPLRQVASYIKALQMRDNGDGPTPDGWTLRYVSPVWLLKYPHQMQQLDALEPNLWRRFLTAALEHFLDVSESIPTAAWTRCLDSAPTTQRWFCIAPPSHRPESVPVYQINQWHHADYFWTMIPELRELGVPAPTLNRLKAWCEKLWPAGNWAAR